MLWSKSWCVRITSHCVLFYLLVLKLICDTWPKRNKIISFPGSIGKHINNFLIGFFFVVVTGVPVCFRILSCVSPGPAAHSFIDFSSRFVLYLCLLAIFQGSFGERCERRAEFILAKWIMLSLIWVWADSFLGQKFLASGCFLLAGSARIAAWSRWLSSTRHSINMHNMTGFGGRLLECWFVSSSEWNDVWLWSHQAWTSKARESLPPRSWGCHWLVTMCLCPIDCEMVCCYTAVLHLRPTEVIDWFGHVECSHLVCSNVFFLLGFFFLPSSSLPFPLHPQAASAGWGVGAGSRKRQRSASPWEQSGAAASAALIPAQRSDSLVGGDHEQLF